MVAARTPRGSNPRSTRSSETKLRTSRPAPTRSTRASANCTTTNALWSRRRGRDAPERDHQSGDTSGEGEHETLGGKLSQDASAAGAEGDAHRNFTLALDRAREQESGDVAARYQEDESNGAHQHEQRLSDVPDRLLWQ